MKDLFMMDPLLWICLGAGLLLLAPWHRLGKKKRDD
jgi:hypothetical protein